MLTPRRWHIIAPHAGGVGDYSRQLAAALAGEGDEVHLWEPDGNPSVPLDAGVIRRTGLGRFAPMDLMRVDRKLGSSSGPRHLLVQWVPHGYGWRSANLPFCLWVWKRSVVNGDRIELVVHEPALAFGEGSWRQDVVALAHRLMLLPLLAATRQVWVTIPAWERRLRPYTLGRSVAFEWLPVGSNVPVDDDPAGVHRVRERYAGKDDLLIGHFGTYGKHIGGLLRAVLPELLLSAPRRSVLLLGRGGGEFRRSLEDEVPDLRGRLYAPGGLPERELSWHIGACDLMVQPYPDGVSARRTSTMAGMAHGRAIVSTTGHLTEPYWVESGAVILTPLSEPSVLVRAAERLLADATERRRIGSHAQAVYRKKFAIEEAVARLRDARHTISRDS